MFKAKRLSDVPFPMVAAVSEPARLLQMGICVRQRLPKLWPTPIDETKSISIACYGPSLRETWQSLTRPIISMSGAHDFLIARGIVPDYHVDMEPRPHKLVHLFKPHKDVHYLMASVCHPFVWSLLKGHQVSTFHVVSGPNTYSWLQLYDPQTLLVIAGSSMGLGAMHVGGILGYRHFEIHGMDGCFQGAGRHADKHYGHPHEKITWEANGRTWETSRIMVNSAVELINVLREYPFFAVLHGQGLQQDMVIEAALPNGAVAGTPQAELVRTARIQIVPMEVAQ